MAEAKQQCSVATTEMSAAWGRVTAIALFVVCVATVAIGQGGMRTYHPPASTTARVLSPELSTLLQQRRALSQRLNIIVQFKPQVSAAGMQRIARIGGTRPQPFNSIYGGAFNLKLSVVQQLAQDPSVAYISPDREIRAAGKKDPGSISSYDFAEATVGADVAHSYGWDGSGVSVAVIDSGISDHPDLHDPVTGQSRVIYNESFLPAGDVFDHYGHGTHVAGIIAGNAALSGGTSNPNGIYGVAPNVHLLNLKVLDNNGQGRDSYIIAALQRAIALK